MLKIVRNISIDKLWYNTREKRDCNICFAAILTSADFVAKAYGIDTVAILREFGYRIVEMFEGDVVEYNGITIHKPDKSIKYKTCEEFLRNKKINNIVVENGVVIVTEKTDKKIIFYTGDPHTNLEIYTNKIQ